MGRRKKSSTVLKSLKPSVQVTGIILILIGIIGFGVFGPVGRYIKSFGVFLFGKYFIIFDILVFVLGLYMLFKKQLPNFVNMKLIGLYLTILSFVTIMN
jgi:S-DNA-T family DNA segregation ATPase FtsK/SpoIIIE